MMDPIPGHESGQQHLQAGSSSMVHDTNEDLPFKSSNRDVYRAAEFNHSS